MKSIVISPDAASISDNFYGVLLDAYGVFWGGNAAGPLPGAKESMARLISDGKIVGILSNSTQLASKEETKWLPHGLVKGTHFHFCLTSGEIARQVFLSEPFPFPTPNHRFWPFSSPHPRFASHEALFRDTPYREADTFQEADFVYLSIPHIDGEDQIDIEPFREQIEKLRERRLPMVCANPDRFAHEGNPPRAVVRQGSLAKMYEEMGGEVFYLGKPHSKAYAAAMACFRSYGITQNGKVLMVGDTPETDIQGARRFGFPSALVMNTGIMADRIQHHGLEGAVNRLDPSDTPDYYIDRLGASEP